MRTLCIWGSTRADVLAGYRFVDQWEEQPQRITWRLTSSFTGEPVGDYCYAPDNPEISAVYEDAVDGVSAELEEVEAVAELDVEDIPQVEEVAVQKDNDGDD